MAWPPVDAEEYRELRDQESVGFGGEVAGHHGECVGGWLGEDEHGRPRPCPECRPHLVTLRDGRITHRASLVRRFER